MTITAAADGSALGNPGPAGWAWYIDDRTWHAGGWPRGTNNMGELMAVLDLLESTASDPRTADEELLVLCDSQYVINSVTKWMPGWKRRGWKKRDGRPVLNVELMQAIDAALKGRRVRFEWVKGHAGHPLNEAADRRANAAATAFRDGVVPDEGPGLGGYPTPGARSAGKARPVRSAGPTESAGSPVPRSDSRGPQEREREDAPDPTTVAVQELALLSDVVRSDPDLAEQLLSPDLGWTDSSGKVLDREAFLGSLAPLAGFDAVDDLCEADIVATPLSQNVILTTYETDGPRGRARCSSVWVNDGERWTLRHHQATPVLE
ncbi:ribonuclease HI family protein [Corynebacterium neomassiliense]|uniref:ribonuclease HI family protein n=1 Tax=Corynebacterium neomassiliense TaxID=2079482 RepID=UPI0010305CD2|nr:ribonuclease HI family protein [Corynebacterium neomassiliense]